MAGLAIDAMRILVVGGSGQLGTEIRRNWTHDDVVAPPHGQLDIEDATAVDAAIALVKPDALVNCAAFHNVDRCESEPERAYAVNAIAVDRAAALCELRGVAFVTFSTDYVFDGTATRPYVENDCPRPLSVYGVSKLAGELLTQRRGAKALIVRTCGVYGVRPSASKGHTFVDRVIAQARATQPMRVVTDVVASPTFAGHLATAVRRLLEAGASGLYHVADRGPVSWYDFAAEALRQAGIGGNLEPISAAVWKTTAPRPAFSALESGKLRSIGVEMPDWREGIAAYLGLRAASGEA
ncbi:MAG: dTDP-4-dehydrorhamnose reductase [Candidatus Eremiobacteraeota bacterium]|nr:dTDP-4-dehydrorhamnose reductase [Candidatus Eremiobacteraeota bacterium]